MERGIFLWFAELAGAVAVAGCLVAGIVVNCVVIGYFTGPAAGKIMKRLSHAACDVLRRGESGRREEEDENKE